MHEHQLTLSDSAKRKESFLTQWMRKRIYQQNRNVIGYFDGQQGSGKSYSALSVAESMDFTFNVDRVCFDVQEVAKLMNSHLPKGAFVVFDEAGVGVHNLNFWSTENKSLNHLLQTFRDKNLGFLMTTPSGFLVDSQIKRLQQLHFSCSPYGLNRELGYNRVTVKEILTVSYKKDPLERYFKKWNNTLSRIEQMKMIRIHKPSDALCNAYEEKRSRFRSKLDIRMLGKLSAIQEKMDQEI